MRQWTIRYFLSLYTPLTGSLWNRAKRSFPWFHSGIMHWKGPCCFLWVCLYCLLSCQVNWDFYMGVSMIKGSRFFEYEMTHDIPLRICWEYISCMSCQQGRNRSGILHSVRSITVSPWYKVQFRPDTGNTQKEPPICTQWPVEPAC